MLSVRTAALVGALSLTLALAPTVAAQASPTTPTPTGVAPAFGPASGGGVFTVTGTALGGPGDIPAVTVGGQPATSVVVNAGGTSITAVAPGGATGDADVTVTTTAGTGTDTGAYHYYAFVSLQNSAIRFGTGAQDSVNASGTLEQPWYHSPNDDQWYQLTYSDYSLDYAIGVGTGGSNWTTNEVFTNPALEDRTVDFSGFTGTASGAGLVGTGAIVSSGTATLGGVTLRVQQSYSLGAADKYVKDELSVTNLSGQSAQNVHLWAGTRDDYVGSSDSTHKTKGNLVDGAFVPITDAAAAASALEVTTGAEGILFYSTAEGTNASMNRWGPFSNAYDVNPVNSPMETTSDGSYAIVLRVGDVAPGQTSTLTWFYAAGAIADLAAVANEVAAAAAPAVPAGEPGNGEVTITWTAPQSEAPITDYLVRWSDDGGLTWTDVPHETPSTATERIITGLENGTSYLFEVAAVTGTAPDTAQGPWSSPSEVVLPGAPSAPVLTGITAGDASATVAFTASVPSVDRSPVTNYEYRVGNGTWTALSPADTTSPVTVPGLTNGAQVSIRLRGVTVWGASAPSNALTVTPAAPPRTAPTTAAPAATAGDGSVALTWVAPDSLEAITDYVVRWSDDDGETWTTVQDEAPSTATSTTVTGLVNGTAYTFEVAVVIGTDEDALQGDWSEPSLPATPHAITVPGIPTGLTASPFDAAVDLEWVAPENDGGATITGYVVELSYDGGDTWYVVGEPEAGTTRTVVDLTNGMEYLFRVSAVNEIGTGDASDPSDPVVPRARFQPPANPTATYPASVGVTVGSTVRIAPVMTLPEHATGFVVVNGTLPIGLRLDATTGAIVGVPLAQGGPFTVRIGVRGPYGDVVGTDDVAFTARGGYLVRFNAGSRSLSSQTYKVLRQAAAAVKACRGCTLEIRGYAAYIHGSAADARRIAALRALTVQSYLRGLGVGRAITVTLGVGHARTRGALVEQRKAVVVLRTPVR